MLQPSSSLVIGALVRHVCVRRIVADRPACSVSAHVAVLALTVMLSMKLIGFLMLAIRDEAISQILGLLGARKRHLSRSQILVPGMPLLIEMVILFDLLIVVACFGVLVRYLVSHVGNTSSRATAAAGGLSHDRRAASSSLCARASRCVRPRLPGARGRLRLATLNLAAASSHSPYAVPLTVLRRGRALSLLGEAMSLSTPLAPG